MNQKTAYWPSSTNDFLVMLLFFIFSTIATAFDEISASNPALVKEYTYNCPWCEDLPRTGIHPMLPISTYKPNSWDKYYIDDIYGNRTTVGSGIAAGITIGVFFTVFLLTFGCRMYSARIERLEREQTERTIRNSIAYSEDFMRNLWACDVPRDPPPPYEVAITMPRCDTSPPPVSTSTSPSSTNSAQRAQFS